MTLFDENGIDRTEMAREVFGYITNSMDFGSGFLCDEDIILLRRFARLIDVDPDEATPPQWDRRTAGVLKVTAEHATQVTTDWIQHHNQAVCICGWSGTPQKFQSRPTWRSTQPDTKKDDEKYESEVKAYEDAYYSAMTVADQDGQDHVMERLEAARDGTP